MFKAHLWLDDSIKISRRMEHLPNVGDTVRFNAGRYGEVTEIIWCMDEDWVDGQRVNIRVESIDDEGI